MEEFLAAESSSLLMIGCCLLISAFFSSAETAITSLGTLKVKHLIDSKGRKASALKLWLAHPSRVITTILVFNNIVNILASAITTKVTYKYFGDHAIGIATGVITFCVLVFGEILPKSIAKAHSESMALISMRVILLIYYPMSPIIRTLSGFADLTIRLLSKGAKKAPLITEEELEFMVSEGEKAGVIGDIKKDIIEGAFDFDETKVREIMTPRTDLIALSEDANGTRILEKVIKTGHSRIPIYRGSMDNIVGLVLAKDLLGYIETPQKITNIRAKDLMRDAFYAPESKSIMDVFKDLKRTKNHLAVIIDEYGGTAGIVTMEDILEEIVGEIQDEFDAEEAEILKIDENVFEVSGSINIEDFLDYFSLEPAQFSEEQKINDVDTLAGWITQMVGEMPKVHQKVQVGNLEMEVLEVSHHRISIVQVTSIVVEEPSEHVELSKLADNG